MESSLVEEAYGPHTRGEQLEEDESDREHHERPRRGRREPPNQVRPWACCARRGVRLRTRAQPRAPEEVKDPGSAAPAHHGRFR